MISTAAVISMADTPPGPTSLTFRSLEDSPTENVSNRSKMLSSMMVTVKHWRELAMELNVSCPDMGPI